MTIEKKRPGRPPKWKQGTVNKHYYFPTDLVQKLKNDVKDGKFESEVEAIYHYVMFSEKADEYFEEVKKLREKLALKEKEIEALKARIKVLESEVEELEVWKQKALELEREVQELQVKLMKVESGVDSLPSQEEFKRGGETKEGLWSLVERYIELRKELSRLSMYTYPPEMEVRKLERELEMVQQEVNVILEGLGVDKVSFWRVLNSKGLDEAKKLVGD